MITRVHKYLNHTAWILRITISQKVLTDNLGNLFVDSLILEVDNFTHDVVGKLIIDQILYVIHNLVYQSVLLWLTTSLKTCLHYAATLFVSSDVKTIVYYCLVYRVFVLVSCKDIKTCLNNVVSMNVYS